jgi:hypothetical protein
VRTLGVAEKVSWPAVALTAIGAALCVVGAIVKDQTLGIVGASVIAAAGLGAGVGAAAPAPETTPVEFLPGGVSEEQLEHELARASRR